jgi:RNA 3'-terminal phosphate cyclase
VLQPLAIEVKGITERPGDIGTDVLRAVTLPLLRESRVTAFTTVKQRSVGPHRQGAVHLNISALKSIDVGTFVLRIPDRRLVLQPL